MKYIKSHDYLFKLNEIVSLDINRTVPKIIDDKNNITAKVYYNG
jgi:hypothetical protein